jgi:hypothetical protein
VVVAEGAGLPLLMFESPRYGAKRDKDENVSASRIKCPYFLPDFDQAEIPCEIKRKNISDTRIRCPYFLPDFDKTSSV